MSDRAIIESIYKMTGQHKVDTVTYADAVVNSVNLPARTCSCTVIAGHTEYQLNTVKLMAVVDDGLLIEPVIGSTVKLIFSVNLEAFVCQYSEIENIIIDARTKIKLNDGSFGGLVKVSDLVDKLNTLENDINVLKGCLTAFIAGVNALPPVVPMLPPILSATLGAALGAYTTDVIIPTIKRNLKTIK